MKKILITVITTIGIFSFLNLNIEFISHVWLRSITSVVFFLSATGIGGKKRFGILAFFFLMICDFFLPSWEKNLAKLGYYIFHIFSIVTLLFLTIRVLKKVNITFFDIIVLTGFLGVNGWILLYLGGIFQAETEDVLLNLLFYVNGSLIILLVLAAFFFSTNNANPITAYFFIGVMFVAISELTLFAIFFMNEDNWRYFDTIFYAVGLFFLLRSYQEHITQEKSIPQKEPEKVPEANDNEKKNRLENNYVS